MSELGLLEGGSAEIKTPGGVLNVRYSRIAGEYRDIWLTGPCECVFTGMLA
jgi:hypothetical protein